MRVRPIISLIAVIVSVLISCSVAIGFLLNGCFFWECAPPRSFTVFDMDLPLTLFPEASTRTPLHQPSELSGAQDADTSNFYWNEGNGLAVYSIDRFGNDKRAFERYDVLVKTSEYPVSAATNHSHSVAGQYVTGCGVSAFGGEACLFLAQYDEFVLSFHAYLDRAMTVERFEMIAAYIESELVQRMQ